MTTSTANLDLYQIAKKTVHKNWGPFFQKNKDNLKSMSETITRKHEEIFPYTENIFRAYKTNPEKIKVVILGQDPYPTLTKTGHPRAVGLSFSVAPDDIIPSSLNNIFTELQNNIDMTTPKNGDLTAWVKRGVFLLNSALTVPPKEEKAHVNVWKGFILDTLRFLLSMNKNLIFVCWGKDAEKVVDSIDEVNEKYVLRSSHPSGLSARKGNNPFIGNQHFRKINDLLLSQGRGVIDWSLEED